MKEMFVKQKDEVESSKLYRGKNYPINGCE